MFNVVRILNTVLIVIGAYLIGHTLGVWVGIGVWSVWNMELNYTNPESEI